MFGGTYEKKESKGFEPIPKGRYSCILDNACLEQTAKNKTNYLAMNFTIVSGPFANRKIWHKMWFTEAAYDMAAQQLDNMGVFSEIKPATTIEGFMTNAAEVAFKKVGAKFEVSVTGHDEFNEKLYEKTFITGDAAKASGAIPNMAPSAPAASADEEIPF